LRTIDNLRLLAIECFSNLSSNEGLARAWWPIEEHTLAVFDAILLDNLLGVAPRVESASENLGELLVETADTQLLKAHVLLKKLLGLARVDFDLRFGLLVNFESENGVFVDDAEIKGARVVKRVKARHEDGQDDLGISDRQREQLTSVELFLGE